MTDGLNRTSIIPEDMPDEWHIEFSLPAGFGGTVFRIASEKGKNVVCAGCTDGVLRIELVYDYSEKPLILQKTVRDSEELTLSAKPNRVALLNRDGIADEEWPIGRIALAGASVRAAVRVKVGKGCVPDPAFVGEEFTDIENWKPKGENTNIGDCMPFSDGEIYRVYYLLDRRHHSSKWSLGAHQWAQVSTKDFVTWKSHPTALRIDEQWEGSVCTGSVIRHKGLYYAFYAVRMSDRSPAKLTWAVSDDGEQFRKSGEYLTLTSPYEGVSARDPKVFRTEDGLFHMLVTTSVEEKNVGALAHLVSDDLHKWKQLDPFLVLDIPNQPECSDWFRFGDWYYLLYSNYGIGKWFKSRSPLGPWEAPENNLVATEDVGVPKAAILNGRLIFTGFTTEGPYYAGNFVLYEGIQSENGDLSFRHI